LEGGDALTITVVHITDLPHHSIQDSIGAIPLDDTIRHFNLLATIRGVLAITTTTIITNTIPTIIAITTLCLLRGRPELAIILSVRACMWWW
jgi:hypothetical protein